MSTSTCTRLSVLAASLLFTVGSADLIASSASQNFAATSLEDAQQKQEHQLGGRDERSTYIIRLHEEPVARYRGGVPGFEATSPLATGDAHFDPRTPQAEAYRSYLKTRQDEVLAGIAAETGVSLDPDRRWQYAVNGFSAEMDGLTARKISAMPEVKHIKKELHRVPLTFRGPDYVGAPDIWEGGAPSELATKGEGTVVAIFDTGVNWDHVSFAEVAPADGYVHENPLGDGVFLGVCDEAEDNYNDAANCNNKFIGAYDVIGGDGNDGNGHGTHVAGTAAGNELTAPGELEISGVAPRANVVSYRVCDNDGCAGGVDAAEHVLANHADLVDTINYSIGPVAGGGDPYAEATAQAFLSLNEAGILVAAAGGNSGPGVSTISNFGPWNMTVASNNHGHSFVTDLSVTGPEPVPGDLQDITPIPASGLNVDEAFEAELVAAGDVDAANEFACDPLPADSMDGMIGVANVAGGCNFDLKAEHMAAAGAIGVVYYSAADINPGIAVMAGDFPIPAVWVDYPLGPDFIDWVETEDNPTAEFHETELRIVNEHAMAASSSRGPGQGAYTDLPGPDIVAPGASIFAAWIGGEDEYATIGGTSMASPHVAGGIALMRALYPDWSATEIQSALMLSANPGPVLKEDGSTPATILDRGNGLMSLGAAANAGLVLDESRANFEDANPTGGSLELHELNVPFLTNSECAEEGCEWTRTLTATQSGSWSVIAGLESGSIDVEPSSFSLAEGETQEITVSVSGDPSSDWVSGGVLIQETSGSSSNARFPVAVIFDGEPDGEGGVIVGDSLDLDGITVPGGAPNTLEIEVMAPAGEVSGFNWDITYESNSAGLGAWLNEFRMEIEAPDGQTILVAGAEGSIGADPAEEVDYDLGWPGSIGTESDDRTIADFDGSMEAGVWTIRLWGTYTIEPHGWLIDGSIIDFGLDATYPAPEFDPMGASALDGDTVDVTVTSADTELEIRYTDDGSEPDQDTGTVINSGDSISLTSTTTLKAVAYDPDGGEEDISLVTSADFAFYDAVGVEDMDGEAIGSISAAAGDSVHFVPTGGSGDYEFSANNLTSGVEAGISEVIPGLHSVDVPNTGAFAGDYEVTITDPVTGSSDSFTVSVGLEIDSHYELVLANGDRSMVSVRGATPDYGFSFFVEDDEGNDGSSIATMGPEQSDAADDPASGNAAVSDLVTEPVSETTEFQVRAEPEDGTYDAVVVDNLTVDLGRTYSGWIYNELDDPIEGALVASEENIGPDNRQFTTETDSDGVFSLTTPEPDGAEEHNLSATRSGYVSAVFSGDGCVGDTPQCQQVMYSSSAEISGHVLGLLEDEEVNLYLVYENDETLELGPVMIVGAGDGEEAFTLDANHDAAYPEIRARGFGYEDASVDNDGEAFSFESEGDSIEDVDVEMVPTTPMIEDVVVADVGEEAATIQADVDANERATMVTLHYGDSADDLDSSLDEVNLSATDGLMELEFEVDGLSCEAEVFFQVSATNDRESETMTDVDSFTTNDCAPDDDGDDDGVTPPSTGGGSSSSFLSCSMSDGKGAVDPLLPLLALLAMVGLFARRRV